jgi:hypothetical protein
MGGGGHLVAVVLVWRREGLRGNDRENREGVTIREERRAASVGGDERGWREVKELWT